MSSDHQAKGVFGAGEPVGPAAGQPSSGLSPTLESELRGCLERVLRAYKAEDVAGRIDRKRSTVYRWAGSPGDVPLGALTILTDLDPDPESLARIAGVLLAHVSARALAREAQGRAVLILEEIAPGRWGRRS